MATALAYQRVMPYGAGLAPVYVAADPAGNTFNLSPAGLLHVKNTGGSPVTVTVHSNPDRVPTLGDTTATVAAGAETLIGPFPANAFHYRPIGRVITAAGEYDPGYVTFSSTSGVLIAALALDESFLDINNVLI